MSADQSEGDGAGGRGAACPGCGASVPGPGAVTPPSVGASPACWAAYGDLVAREYGEWSNPPVHRLTAATYAAQHPGRPDPRAVQGLAVHLIGLHFAIDRGMDLSRVPREIGRAVADPWRLRWLEPPADPDWQTILDVRGARDLKEHTARVQRWARSVWEAWSAHHDEIRDWTAR